MRSRIDDILAGAETDDGFAPSVWDEWNAKTPEAMRTDALVADAALVERLASLTDEERAGFRFQMGPMDLDFDGLVRLRLNEHAAAHLGRRGHASTRRPRSPRPRSTSWSTTCR